MNTRKKTFRIVENSTSLNHACKTRKYIKKFPKEIKTI